MSQSITCAKIGCPESTSYEKPLCLEHWRLFDRFQLFECSKCHWFAELALDGKLLVDEGELCQECRTGKAKPIHPHTTVSRQERYLYILKLADSSYYVGQTKDLEFRLNEHRGGLSKYTAGKDPKLVWFEKWIGDKQRLDAKEKEMSQTAKTSPYKISRMITEWQRPFRLLDRAA